jgi:hypothetical protein
MKLTEKQIIAIIEEELDRFIDEAAQKVIEETKPDDR